MLLRQDLQTLKSFGVRLEDPIPNNGLLVLDTRRWMAARGAEHMVQTTNQLRDANFSSAKFATMLSSQTPIAVLTNGLWADVFVGVPKLWNVEQPHKVGLSMVEAQQRLHNTSIVLHMKGRAKLQTAGPFSKSRQYREIVTEWTKLAASSAVQQCLRLEALTNVTWAAKLRT